jgi:hypothetical protein
MPALLILSLAKSGLSVIGGSHPAWKYIRLWPTGTTMMWE